MQYSQPRVNSTPRRVVLREGTEAKKMGSDGRQLFSLVLGIYWLLTLAACGGGSDGGSTTVAAATGTITGQVVSTAAGNPPVAGATVTTTAGTTTTAADGSFTLAAPASAASVIQVNADGYAAALSVTPVTAGQITTLGFKLVPIGVSEAVTVSAGGTVIVPNSTAQVDIPANGLVPKGGGTPAGSVTVSVTPIDPSQDTTLMPGGFTGVSAGGSTTALESFGVLVVDIRDAAGKAYTLAAGQTSTIRIPLGTNNPTPPDTVALWFLDEATGQWKEEGTATLQGTAPDQYYEGTVAHFSSWNADQPALTTWVLGCVRDANGQPVVNALVQAVGVNYTGADIDFTDANGNFKVGVRIGGTADVTVWKWSFNPSTYEPISNVVRVISLDTDQPDSERTLPNCIVVNPAVLTVTTASLAGGNVGATYTQTLQASGGIPGYVWSLDAGSNPLPDGLALNSSGVIVGTPTTAGTTTIIVKVTDSVGGTATKQLSLTINEAGVALLSITTTSPLSPGTVNTPYLLTVQATGGTGATTWSVSAGALPLGLDLNASTGVLSGTPQSAGTSSFTIQVQDSGTPQQSAQKEFTLTINPSSGGGGGGGGTLTISGAPDNVGGTFVADPQFTVTDTDPTTGISSACWYEGNPDSISHFEVVCGATGGDLGNLVVTSFSPVDFINNDPNLPVFTTWACADPLTSCGVTVDLSTNTVTWNNSVLTVIDQSTGQFGNTTITVNGTLTY